MKAAGFRRVRRPTHDEPQISTATRACDHPGCDGAGQYRAPRARDKLSEYYWFCLDHVRAYNAAWNYYAGMSEGEIEGELRRDTTWQRQTWPLGERTGNRRFVFGLHDPLGVFDDASDPFRPVRPAPETAEEKAMRLLGLTPPLSLSGLKARYKELVKRHHPDANNGDKDAEERFKLINQAYTTLLASLGV